MSWIDVRGWSMEDCYGCKSAKQNNHIKECQHYIDAVISTYDTKDSYKEHLHANGFNNRHIKTMRAHYSARYNDWIENETVSPGYVQTMIDFAKSRKIKDNNLSQWFDISFVNRCRLSFRRNKTTFVVRSVIAGAIGSYILNLVASISWDLFKWYVLHKQ